MTYSHGGHASSGPPLTSMPQAPSGPAPGEPQPPGSARARASLEEFRAAYSRTPRPGCYLSSHRDLGFCAGCCRAEGDLTPEALELMAWRLLAIARHGVPNQPTRQEPPR